MRMAGEAAGEDGRCGWPVRLPVGLLVRLPVRLPVGLLVRLSGLAAGTKPAGKSGGLEVELAFGPAFGKSGGLEVGKSG